MLADRHRNQPAQKPIADYVQRRHRHAFHGEDEAAAINELRLAAGDGVIKIRQFLGHGREIGVKNHQDVALRPVKTGAHVERLADARPFIELDVAIRIQLLQAPNLVGGTVVRRFVAEENLGVRAKAGNSFDSGGNRCHKNF